MSKSKQKPDTFRKIKRVPSDRKRRDALVVVMDDSVMIPMYVQQIGRSSRQLT